MISLLYGCACFNPGLPFEFNFLTEAGLSGSESAAANWTHGTQATGLIWKAGWNPLLV